MKYFDKDEFACKCGCGSNSISSDLIEALDEARGIAEVPFKITSGYRCEKHPESLSNPTSSHIKGLAADIAISDSGRRSQILRAVIAAGFHRIGISNGFIHVDIDPGKSANVIWTY